MTNGDKPLEPKWLFYIISIIIGIVGIILGIIYMRKPDPDCKSFGKMCLILGIINCVLWCLCWLIFAVGCGGMSAFT
jgi:bacteriorhodopsin